MNKCRDCKHFNPEEWMCDIERKEYPWGFYCYENTDACAWWEENDDNNNTE